MTITLTKQHLIASLLFLMFIVMTISWWLIDYFVPAFAFLAIFSGIALIVFLIFNRYYFLDKYNKKIEKETQSAIKKLFNNFLKELKTRGLYKQKYRTPWYLYITHNIEADSAILKQMGFRVSSDLSDKKVDLPIQIWLKNNAVMLTVNLSEHSYHPTTCLKFLLQQLKKYRSRQALNGILIGQSIESLLLKNKTNTQQIALDTRLIIDEVQAVSGQKLPLYLLFNQMGHLSDFGEFFASLDESIQEGCFGAVNHSKEYAGKFNLSWFNNAYNQLCKTLGNAVLYVLDQQLNEDFRRSIIAAPVQFKLIKPIILSFIQELLSSNTEASNYEFRAMFFTNTNEHSAVIDPLAQHIGYQLDFNERLVRDQNKLPHAIFVRRLFDDFIRPEAGLAEINKTKKRLFVAFQVGYGIIVSALIMMTIGLIKVNFDYYQDLNNSAVRELHHYKKAVLKRPYNVHKLTDNINNLMVIRKIFIQYNKKSPIYITSIIPNPNLTQAVKQAYYDELKVILFPSILTYLEDELIKNIESKNSLNVAELLNLMDELEHQGPNSWSNLKLYFQHNLIKSGYIDGSRFTELTILMDDFQYFGVPKADFEQTLVVYAKEIIKNININEALLDYIQSLPQFSSVIDISTELGHNFEQLYSVKNKLNIFEIPYIYTPQGFINLNLKANSNLIKNIVANNEALLGRHLNTFEVNTIVGKLQSYYQQSYINYWQNFIDNVVPKTFNADNINYYLNVLSSTSDSPLHQLYNIVGIYTNLEILLKQHQQLEKSVSKEFLSIKAKNKIKGSKQKQILPSELTLLGTKNSIKMRMAKHIQDQFLLYRNFVSVDNNGKSKLSYLEKSLQQVKIWLDQAKKQQDLGAEFFNQLTATEKNQSLYQLSQIKTNINNVDQLLEKLVKTINVSVKKAVVGYLNQQWKIKIEQPFLLQFSHKFPFETVSVMDANIKEFNRYFSTNGEFDQFYQHFLAKLTQQNSQIILNGFTPEERIQINSSVINLFAKVDFIQTALYQKKQRKISVPFKLKVDEMSANLLKFEIFAQRTLFVYQHGPKLWHDFEWPNFSKQQDLLVILTDVNHHKVTQKYQGDWAWLRFVYKYKTHNNIQVISDKNKTNLLLNVESEVNPFAIDLFSQFKMPEELVDKN